MINLTAIKDILKPLERIASRGYHMGSVYRDWVSLVLYALMRDDDLYMEVMGRYKNEGKDGEREADLFAHAFHMLMKWSAKENHDLLGDIYMEIATNYDSKSMGQFFTPIPVCDAMAKMAVGENNDKPVSVADPACGSSRNLISAAKVVHADSFFHGIDLDTVCVRMSAINCCMFNMNAVILHGNTLSMKFFGGFTTHRSMLGGTVRALTEQELEYQIRRVEIGLSEQVEPPEMPTNGNENIKEPQLTLFEFAD
jgi:hypothetical protein